jgi:hypothetical protein
MLGAWDPYVFAVMRVIGDAAPAGQSTHRAFRRPVLLPPMARSGRPDPELEGLTAVDDEGFALVEAADVVGLGAGQGGDLVGLLELVGDDRADGAGEAVADGVVGAEAGPGLGDEDDGDVEAPGPFDEVDSGAGPV